MFEVPYAGISAGEEEDRAAKLVYKGCESPQDVSFSSSLDSITDFIAS
jgi:hypothetical protein